MTMLQVVQKMAASMDLFAPVMAPSMLLSTHEPTIRATRQRTDFQMKFSPSRLRFPEDCTKTGDCVEKIAIPVCVVFV